MSLFTDKIPNNYLPLNGQLQAITNNVVLYRILETRYGGNGVTTFQLPKGGAAREREVGPVCHGLLVPAEAVEVLRVIIASTPVRAALLANRWAVLARSAVPVFY